METRIQQPPLRPEPGKVLQRAPFKARSVAQSVARAEQRPVLQQEPPKAPLKVAPRAPPKELRPAQWVVRASKC